MNSDIPKNAPPPAVATPASNTLLRRVVIIATILSLATADAWMASFDRQPGGELTCRWRWATLIWGLIGGGTCLYFWRKIWPPQDVRKATRREIIIGSGVLLLPSLWWLTFPLRFLSGQTFLDVTGGLVAAALVLTFGACMVVKLIKAFERSDTFDLANPGTEIADPPAENPPGKNPSRGV